MPKFILIAGTEYFRSSEMQSRYFDDHVPGQGVNVNEFLSPGGRRKEIRVKCFKGFKKDKDLYRTRRQVDLDLATSIRFVNFQAKCEPGQVLAKVWKIFKNAKSIKLGKLRPNQKRGEKKQWRYNGWVNFFGSGDCKRARSLVEKKREKYGEMIIEKVGKIRCLGFHTKKKVVALPKKRIPAKKEVPRQFSSWGKRWSPINESRFADDVFDCLLSNGIVLVE